jgi:hypothetical protein
LAVIGRGLEVNERAQWLSPHGHVLAAVQSLRCGHAAFFIFPEKVTFPDPGTPYMLEDDCP